MQAIHGAAHRAKPSLGGNHCTPLSIPRPSPGFTLIEVLLVIALVAVIMAVAWPSFDRLADSRRLQDAAAEIRNFARDARRQAMSDDIAYRVDMLPNSSRLRMVPSADGFEAKNEEQNFVAIEENAMAESPDAVTFVPRREEMELPEGLTLLSQEEFDKGPVEETDRAEPPAEAVDNESVDWIPLCEFFPDGSSSGGVIRIVDPQRMVAELSVRPLTGEVFLGEPSLWMTEEEKEKEREEAMP